MRVYVDATPLYNLGMIGETALLSAFDGPLVVPDAVRSEIDVEPASTNLAVLLEEADVVDGPDGDPFLEEAVSLLGDDGPTSDAALIAAVLAERAGADDCPCCGLVSDDTRIRRLAAGLGATVTSTFGVVVRASLEDKYFSPGQAKRVVRRLDGHGLVTTGPLRERAIGDVSGQP